MNCLFRRAANSLFYILAITSSWFLSHSVAASPLVPDHTFSGVRGWTADISGNLAIIGIPHQSGGRALVFDIVSGQLLHTLKGADTVLNDLFGDSVAIDGTQAIVGARGWSNARGAAYVFDLTTGQQLRKIISPT
jgi:outer membrane protein assembly factor BamB